MLKLEGKQFLLLLPTSIFVVYPIILQVYNVFVYY